MRRIIGTVLRVHTCSTLNLWWIGRWVIAWYSRFRAPTRWHTILHCWTIIRATITSHYADIRTITWWLLDHVQMVVAWWIIPIRHSLLWYSSISRLGIRWLCMENGLLVWTVYGTLHTHVCHVHLVLATLIYWRLRWSKCIHTLSLVNRWLIHVVYWALFSLTWIYPCVDWRTVSIIRWTWRLLS